MTKERLTKEHERTQQLDERTQQLTKEHNSLTKAKFEFEHAKIDDVPSAPLAVGDRGHQHDRWVAVLAPRS